MLDFDRSPAWVSRLHSHIICRRTAFLFACVFVLTIASQAQAQSEATPTEKLIALRLDWQTQLAREDVAAWETRIVTIPRGTGLSVGNFQDPSTVLVALGPALDADYKLVLSSLGRVEEKAKTRKDDALKDWTEVIRQRIAFREYVEKQQAAYGFNFDQGSQGGFDPNIVDAALLIWAGVVAIVALQLRRKEQRLELRKAQRVATAGLLFGLMSLPGCGTSSTDGKVWMSREETDLTTARDNATAKTKDAEDAADRKWRSTSEAWTSLVTAKKGDVERVVRDGETSLRDRLHEIAVNAQLADRLVKDADEQRMKLAEEKAKLDELISGAKWRSRIGMGLRVGLACVLFGMSVAPFWVARRRRAKRIRLAARTCPRCFRLNTLKIERTGAAPTTKRKKKKTEDDEEDEPEDDGEVRCTKCGLRIRKSYLTVPRLCFPTVGVRSSGKTHMLVTAYDRIRKRTAPTVAIVQPAPTGGDVDRRFDQLIDEILHRRGVAGATDLVLPDPILIHLKDADSAGGNTALVNLFDYSGELINPDVDVNMLKATAVRMDGFMLFLDPTQLYGDGANVTFDQQLGMLDVFLAHMRKERKIPVGEVIPVPVAVCLPKFDLLITDNPIGGQSVQYIHEMIENLSPPPRQMTMDVIRERSDLVEQMLPLMFPGAEIRSVIEGYFGKQLLFFPLSSVSLNEHELGVKDLSQRNIAPFGVSEPILWLLHMHGYDVFAKN
ncbi:MAG: hypothetical protein K8U57_00315 [Planctomycetes bacterium]|nr:hypothetical protein [Planctomycetota bacterium]